ncbi:M15 family metallopeptidase [Clostridium manihotivorum]|nr:M15 family metallopeptidase [Clostridium manihotivorum]
MVRIIKNFIKLFIFMTIFVLVIYKAYTTRAFINLDVPNNPESISVLVNKDCMLKDSYVPSDLVVPKVDFSKSITCERKLIKREAGEALEKLCEAAKKQNVNLYIECGYISYKSQEILIKKMGKEEEAEDDKYVATPGANEHQTGLAIDITNNDGENSYNKVKFSETKEGQWLAKNCYEYGFILRYPQGKENVTGYKYKPWHIRYVGKDISRVIQAKNITLEEYIRGW